MLKMRLSHHCCVAPKMQRERGAGGGPARALLHMSLPWKGEGKVSHPWHLQTEHIHFPHSDKLLEGFPKIKTYLSEHNACLANSPRANRRDR